MGFVFFLCLFYISVSSFCLILWVFFYGASGPVMAPGLGEAALCRRRPVFLVFHLFPLCLLVLMLLVPVLVSSWPITTLSLLVTRTICSRAAPMWAACTLLLRHSQTLWAAGSTDPPDSTGCQALPGVEAAGLLQGESGSQHDLHSCF